MTRKGFIVSIVVLCLFMFLIVNKLEKPQRYTAEFLELFDTVTQVVGYTENERDFEEHAKAIKKDLLKYHQLYDIYNDYDGINNIKTINDNAGIKPVKVEPEIIRLLIMSKVYYDLTNSKMNVAEGAVLKIWHEYRTEGIRDPENAKLPDMEDLKEASKHTDINKVIIDGDNSTVFLEDKEMSLDVGAIAKGFAVNEVAINAEERGFKSGLISVGGNVKVIGEKPEGDGNWNIGIENPEKDEPFLMTVSLKGQSLVTSGDYMRYYTVDGKKYNHIIDPATLMPATYFRSVTIITNDSGKADALSTGVFNMPYDEGRKLIESLPDTEALWYFASGEKKYTEGLKKMEKK